jgi:RNA polymerase sigma-70 factor, ECF subfamily
MPISAELSSKIESQRPYLMRYAALQLRDRDLAEDVVQETLLAALEGGKTFEGRSQLRTWLTGILKHKLIDALRKGQREVTLAGESGEDGEDPFEALFDERGHWNETPMTWANPDASLEQGQFFDVLEQCLGKLPAKTAQVFMMREHLGVDTEQICQELKITSTHCWVLLYRARMALKLCLEGNWFAPSGRGRTR